MNSTKRLAIGSKRILLCIGKAILLVFLFGAITASARPSNTPPDLVGVTVVTAEEAFVLIKNGVPIIDTRTAHEYVEEHIKGAVFIPYKEKSDKHIDYNPSLDRFDILKLPQGESAPMIFYCNAGECWKSYKACRAAIKAGYTNVYWLRGGIPEWKAKSFPVE